MGAGRAVSDSIAELYELVAQLERRRQIYRSEYYKPYPYQLRFHNAEGYKTGKLAVFRALCAGNGIGKTVGACMEDSYHATGRYPDWWTGHRFRGPVGILVAGVTNESARDILQKELLGDPTDPRLLGTGTVPIDCIGKIARKAGMINAIDSVKVKHVSGRWSTIYFRAYEQGARRFMGTRFDVIHGDEEPPPEIYSQIVRAMMSRKNAIAYLTFTPENGMTEVVDRFMNQPSEGQAFINAGWMDAPHMIDANGQLTEQARIVAGSVPKHELDMRMRGLPLTGSHLIFNVPDEQIRVEPFMIPKHWPRINGIDFGFDHPFAAASLAWDRDADCVYLTNEYRESRSLPAVHTQAIQAWGEWIPVSWPHDGLNSEKSTGDQLIKQYRDTKLNCLPNRATHPPQPGEKEGTGGNSVEVGLLDMLTRMETGRFKVFATCTRFFEEKRTYHRKDGKIVKIREDLVDACRYAMMSLRFARIDKAAQQAHTATTTGGVRYMTARPNRRPT